MNPGTQSQSHPEHRVPEVTRKSWFRSHSEIRVPGVTRKSAFPGLLVPGVTWNSGPPWSPRNTDPRSHRDSGFPGSRSYGWIRETRDPGDSGNLEFRVTRGTWNSGWLGELGFPDESGNTVRSHQEHRVPGVNRTNWSRSHRISVFPEPPTTPRSRSQGNSGNTEFRVILGTRSSCWLREPGFPDYPWNVKFRKTPGAEIPVDSGNPEFRWLQELQVTRNSDSRSRPEIQKPVNPEYRVTSGTRSPGNPELRVTTGTKSSGRLWDWVPGITRNSGFPELRVSESSGTPVSRSHEWLRVSAVRVTGFPVVTRNSGFPESNRTLGSRNHPDLRIPESTATPCSPRDRNSRFPSSLPGVTGNSGFRETPGIPGFGVTMNSGFSELHGTPCSHSHPELWVPEVNGTPGTRSPGNAGLRLSPGTRISGWLRERGVPDDCGIGFPGFTRNSGFPVSYGNPGDRYHQNAAFPHWVPEFSRNYRFPESSGPPGFGVTRNSGFP